MTTTTKDYGTVQPIITNEGEGESNLVVTAFLSPSELAPEGRILIGSNQLVPRHSQIPAFLLSVGKWRELESLVNLAVVDITRACPAHGDRRLIARDPDAGRSVIQALRDYLGMRWLKLSEATRDATHRQALVDEAEQVAGFMRWMDEARLGK